MAKWTKYMKNIFRKEEAKLNIFRRETEDIKEVKIDLLYMKIIMSVMNSKLYASEELISELEDMQYKVSKMKHTEENTEK